MGTNTCRWYYSFFAVDQNDSAAALPQQTPVRPSSGAPRARRRFWELGRWCRGCPCPRGRSPSGAGARAERPLAGGRPRRGRCAGCRPRCVPPPARACHCCTHRPRAARRHRPRPPQRQSCAPCRSPAARPHTNTPAYTTSSCSCPSRISSPTSPHTRESRLASVRNPGSTSFLALNQRLSIPALASMNNLNRATRKHVPQRTTITGVSNKARHSLAHSIRRDRMNSESS